MGKAPSIKSAGSFSHLQAVRMTVPRNYLGTRH